MKTLLALAALAAFNVTVAQKTISLEDFKSITVGSDIKLNMIKGKENKIVIDKEEEFDVENSNGNLVLQGDGGATLYFKNEFESLTVGSDAEVRSTDEIKGKSFQLTAGSDSEVALNLNVKELQVTAGSDSEISLSGKTGSMIVTIGSDGEFRAQELNVGDATINLGSDAQGTINAKDNVNATVASDGTLNIYGKPKKVNEVKGDDSVITIM